jgi:hypothetical protein
MKIRVLHQKSMVQTRLPDGGQAWFSRAQFNSFNLQGIEAKT